MPTYPTYKLGEVADYINGRAFKPSEWKEKGLPIVRIQNLNDENAEYHYSDVTHEDKYLLHNGDLLFAWAASLGTYIWNSGDAWLNQHIFKVIPKENVSKKYLYYALTSIIKELYAKSHGSGMVHVTKDKFVNTEIPLPPLPTQHAIVSRIETLFAELDKGVEHLRTAQQQLKTYRQAVLNHWLNNDDGRWEMVKLGEVADAIDPEPSHRTPKAQKDGIPFVSIKDCDYITNTINLKTARLVSKDVLTEHKERYSIKEGDFIIGKIGTIGNPVNVILPQEYALSANVVLIQPTDKINAKFLYNTFRSNIVEKQLFDGKKATTQAAFGIKKVRLIEIPLPPLSEQQRIVNEIESRLSQATASETYIENALQQAEALRQSILKKAFEGELVVSTGSTTANCG